MAFQLAAAKVMGNVEVVCKELENAVETANGGAGDRRIGGMVKGEGEEVEVNKELREFLRGFVGEAKRRLGYKD